MDLQLVLSIHGVWAVSRGATYNMYTNTNYQLFLLHLLKYNPYSFQVSAKCTTYSGLQAVKMVKASSKEQVIVISNIVQP